MKEQNYKWVGTRPVRPDGVPKVTGAAKYGSDYSLPGMLVGKMLRSPHPHARIISIDTSQAEQLPGVKAVVTSQDFPEQPFQYMGPSRVETNPWHVTRNIMAREKVLYEGHALAAVAATDTLTAETALTLIKVEYEVLPHVIDVEDAIAEDAPLLFEDMITRGPEPPPTKPSNIAKASEYTLGDVAKGFAQADVVVEKSYRTAAVHQGYIEPHACVAHYQEGGHSEIWFSSQGHFPVRQLTARIVGMPVGDIKAIPAEIGGGFGGKTIPYLEPVALLLSKKSARPVKMVMSRTEVFQATGPTSGSVMRIKLGAKRDGTIIAAEADYKFQAGAFPQSPVENACLCGFAMYSIENQYAVGYHVVSNRPKVVAYRAPGSPISSFGVESTLDLLAKELDIDPLELRLKNAAHQGDPLLSGIPLSHEGVTETMAAIQNHPAYQTELGPNQGRGVAAGFWHNAAGESGTTVYINADGTVNIATGSPDIGGSRASMALMAAETFGIDYHQVRSTVNDTSSVPYTHITGGSRVTYATGLAVVQACNTVIEELRTRAAKIWEVDVEAVEWKDGHAVPSSSNVGEFEPLSLQDIAARTAATGGPIGTAHALNATGHAPGFCAQFCDVEVDPETGKVTILRFVISQDAGIAIHPDYVEGQMQGAVAQGVGWALNEEYIYNEDGKLENAGFLDYRIPVASDLPPIETIIVEVPNPNHPFGVKGIAEAGLVPTMACVANAIANATGTRMTSLPMSPPKLLAALESE
ncbi:MAG: xanthine dehydrogenase family protein molybdopterin-binding subunit [Pseudomonadota bacterium]